EDGGLASFGKRCNKVDDFESGLKDLRTGLLIKKRWWLDMNRVQGIFRSLDILPIDRSAEDIENAAESKFANWDFDGRMSATNDGAASETVDGAESESFDLMISDLELDFEGESFFGR